MNNEQRNIVHLLFNTNGRIGRSRWWLGNLLAVLIAALLSFIFHFSIPHQLTWKMFSLHNLTIGSVIGITCFWMHIALNTKRWHDLNREGYYTILNYIPVIGFLISIIVLGFFEGDKHENAYGARAP